MMPEPESTRINSENPLADQLSNERFRMVRRLGSGGMGEVFLAEDCALHRLVAIKAVRPDLCRNAELRKRIERECLLHAKVGPHQHIVTLFDRFEVDGQINLVMEYVAGETLEARLQTLERDGAVMPARQALDLAAQSLDALSRIHAHGIIHRDIKPANIMLARDEADTFCAKLMDFGIARVIGGTDPGTQLTVLGSSSPGTPVYMAPEQIDPNTFGPVTTATDVYAMGILLYQMISGRPPFRGSLTAIFNGHLNCPPPPLQLTLPDAVAGPFGDMLNRALAKRPADRFPSVQDFRHEILRLGAMLPGGAVAVQTRSRPANPPLEEPACTVLATDPQGGAASPGGTVLAGSTTANTKVRVRRTAKKPLWVSLTVLALTLVSCWIYVGWTKSSTSPEPGSRAKNQENVPMNSADTPAPAPAATPAGAPLTPTPSPPPAPPSPAIDPRPTPIRPVSGGASEALIHYRKEQETNVEPPSRVTPAPAKPKPSPKPQPSPTTSDKPQGLTPIPNRLLEPFERNNDSGYVSPGY